VAVPVWVDEIVISANRFQSTVGPSPGVGSVVRQSIPMPIYSTGTQRACTLTADTYTHEGWGALSTDGKVFMFGACPSHLV
jgi:hypothetical protein